MMMMMMMMMTLRNLHHVTIENAPCLVWSSCAAALTLVWVGVVRVKNFFLSKTFNVPMSILR